jgi:hypothetical protein
MSRILRRLLRKKGYDPLLVRLAQWSKHDFLTLSDLLRNIEVFGMTGSGKSSGSLFWLAMAVAMYRKSGGLILLSKPEELSFWQSVFAQAGRLQDLLVFGPDQPLRCNFTQFELENGGDARSLTQFFRTLGEAVAGGDGGGRENDKFWGQSQDLVTYNSIVPLMQAGEPVDATNITKFVATAAYSRDTLKDPEWRNGSFHNQVMYRAYLKDKTSAQKADFETAQTYWRDKFPGQDDKYA